MRNLHACTWAQGQMVILHACLDWSRWGTVRPHKCPSDLRPALPYMHVHDMTWHRMEMCVVKY